MHVCLGAFDVIVQIIAEQLNMGDGGRCHIWVGEVSGEQHERHVANVLGRFESWDAPEFQWRIAISVKHLRRVLDGRKPASVNEFLDSKGSVSACGTQSSV